MGLTQEQIEKINSDAPMEWQENEQGIFSEPNGIPDNVKGLVVYMRWMTGGIGGGSCWDDSDPQPFISDNENPSFIVLDLVLKELCPKISYLDFRKIDDLIKCDENTEWEYYGNCSEFSIKYIVLSELIALIEQIE